MAIRNDLKGKRFGHLTALYLTVDELYKKKKWLCRCDCGREIEITGSNLISGHSTQCKQCQLKTLQRGNVTHNQSHTKLYNVWNGMIQRCTNTNHKSFSDYGGRGITICEEWRSFDNFQKWAWEHGYGEGVEIDRIDNNGNYRPENCRWITRIKNARNKSNNKIIVYNGESKTLSEWATYFGVNYKNLSRNLNKGYTLDEAILRERTSDKSHRKSRRSDRRC